MLKNVVLPAPLGPMIVAILRCGTAKDTSLTAVRPPNCLVRLRVSRIGPHDAPGLGLRPVATAPVMGPASPGACRPRARRPSAPPGAFAPGSGPAGAAPS